MNKDEAKKDAVQDCLNRIWVNLHKAENEDNEPTAKWTDVPYRELLNGLYDAGYDQAKREMEQQKNLDYAIQQFTGYKYGEQGVEELADTMGLKASEFAIIRSELGWLGHDDLKKLDEHFRSKR